MATTFGDAVFIDTNVLVYATQHEAGKSPSAQHVAAIAAPRGLQGRPISLWLSRQVLREYVAATTWQFGCGQILTPRVAADDVRRFAQLFQIAEDSGDVTAKFLDLIVSHPTPGKQVHDANIIATMLAHGIGRLVTFNGADFTRYAGLIELEPV